MKKLWPNKTSHQLWFLGALMLPLTACSGLTSTPYEDAYRVSLTNLGYEVTPAGIVIPAVTAKLTATAGAPDVSELDYTAVILDGSGKPATDKDSLIVPANGTLLVGAKGGYRCTTTPEAACSVNSSDASFAVNGSWAANTAANKAITPGEWAVAHLAQFAKNNGTAQWYAEFTYTAYMTTGKAVSWKQKYQFTNPAKAGS